MNPRENRNVNKYMNNYKRQKAYGAGLEQMLILF